MLPRRHEIGAKQTIPMLLYIAFKTKIAIITTHSVPNSMVFFETRES